MTKIKYYILSLIVISLVMISCQKLDLATADADVPVVEAYLNPAAEILIHVTHQLVYESSDTVVNPIEGLIITIQSEDTSLVCLVDSAGYYRAPLKPVEGKTYTMSFIYNDKVVSATTTILAKPSNFATSSTTVTIGMGGEPGSGDPPTPPTPITLTWDNYDMSYYMVVTESIDSSPEPIFDTAEVVPERIFRSTPERIATQELNPRSFFYYGSHRIILFHLNADYAQLYDESSTSSLNLAKPPTNVVNGLGIFTGIHADTLYVTVKDD